MSRDGSRSLTEERRFALRAFKGDFDGFRNSGEAVGQLVKEKVEWACKPDSVVSDHFSGMMIAHHLGATDPDVNRGGQPRVQRVSSLNFALLGLAPGGVYRARIVTDPAVRSYRTVSPLPVLS